MARNTPYTEYPLGVERDEDGNITKLISSRGDYVGARQLEPMTYAAAQALVAAGDVPDYSTVRITDRGGEQYTVISGALVSSIASPLYTYANLPPASSTTGEVVGVTDIGRGFSLWQSNGLVYAPVNGRAEIAYSTIPIILPSSGSFANNGALTLTTALDIAYPACYMYFPANAIFAGSAAGFYYAEMSSASAATVYNNALSGAFPTAPTSKTAFSTTGPGAYTQTTNSDIAALTVTLPAGCLGVTGGVECFMLGKWQVSAGTKIQKLKLGTTAMYTNTQSTLGTFSIRCGFRNIASESLQVGSAIDSTSGFTTNNGGSIAMGSVNTALSQSVSITMQIDTATLYMVFYSLSLSMVR